MTVGDSTAFNVPVMTIMSTPADQLLNGISNELGTRDRRSPRRQLPAQLPGLDRLPERAAAPAALRDAADPRRVSARRNHHRARRHRDQLRGVVGLPEHRRGRQEHQGQRPGRLHRWHLAGRRRLRRRRRPAARWNARDVEDDHVRKEDRRSVAGQHERLGLGRRSDIRIRSCPAVTPAVIADSGIRFPAAGREYFPRGRARNGGARLPPWR